jgi:beta-lactamase class A
MVRHFIETNTIIYKTTYEKTPHLRGFFIFDIMRNIVVIIISLLLFASCSFNPNPIRSAFKKDDFLRRILKDKDKYEIQILYTEVSKNTLGQTEFTDFEFQLNDQKYFYPASTIKLPIAVMTLSKINELRAVGSNISLKSKINLSLINNKKEIIVKDSITSFQNLIADVFLVSDNSASNVLIDFIGYNYFNSSMSNLGFENTYLNHKFNPDPFVDSSWIITNIDNDTISSDKNKITVSASSDISNLKKGNKRFINGEIINEPLDFFSKNRSSLTDMHNIIKNLIYPEVTLSKFNLNVEDYDFIRYWMSRFTFEDLGAKYIGDEKFFNSYNKFFIHGMDTILNNTDIRVYNKIGQAYGTSTDSAYIKNYKEDVEFFLTATIYTNENKIINDDIYEYRETAIPFLSKLSKAIYKDLLD